MQKLPTKIDGACLLRPAVVRDPRGFFLESWNESTFHDLGLDVRFVQDNQSRSARGVLRGLHYQVGAHAQGKLIRVTTGTIFDVMVDLRRSSPTFGHWEGLMIDGETRDHLWVPPGCAHGFLVVSESVDMDYKCTAQYSAEAERILRWNDPDLAIVWPLAPSTRPILSAKDEGGATFAECEKFA